MKRQEWMAEPMMVEWLEERRMMSAGSPVSIPDGTSNITDGTSNTIMFAEAKGGTSGRIGSIAVDPSDPTGNTSGPGVYKSVDGGKTWG
jgi:hypothetical protein